MNVFRSLYQQGIKMEAAQYRELLDISFTPSMKFVYYDNMRKRYNSYIYDEDQEIPEAPSRMKLDAAGDEAKEVVMGLFRVVKRGMGYGNG